MSSVPRLLITDPVGRRLVALDKPLVTIGRRSDNDVCVPDAGISRLHAEIAADGDHYVIRDCGSRFGTFVNDERTTTRPLQAGDRIRLGDVHSTDIVFVVGEDAPSQERSALAAASELRHMAGLLEGLRGLGSTRVLEDVLALVLDAAIDVTGAERGFIMLANAAGALEFKLARARGRVTLSGQTFETSRKIPESVFATGQTTVVDDLANTALAGQHLGTIALGIRHVLCTALRLVQLVEHREARREQPIIGVLYLDSREKGSLQSLSTRAALEVLSAEAAVAIENARLYRDAVERAQMEQDLKVAAAIQQALLPAGGRSGAFFAAAGASRACRSVGGDFFDYVDLPGDRFGFILGDVAGKGSPAALLAAAMLGMFGAEAAYQTSAAALITRLNRGLFRRRIESRFVTTFYGMLAPDGTLTYSNGGHNPPVLITASGVRRLDTGGLVLGVFEEAGFDEERLTLTAGDLIVAFSDGVTEAENEAGDMFGDDRLVETVASWHGRSAPEILECVLEEVRAFCGKALPNDDATALVIRYESFDNIRSPR